MHGRRCQHTPKAHKIDASPGAGFFTTGVGQSSGKDAAKSNGLDFARSHWLRAVTGSPAPSGFVCVALQRTVFRPFAPPPEPHDRAPPLCLFPCITVASFGRCRMDGNVWTGELRSCWCSCWSLPPHAAVAAFVSVSENFLSNEREREKEGCGLS